jgi:hypothetical protein
MPTRIPHIVRPLLDEYIHLLENELPGFMGAFYLHGSLALDAFDTQFSDIDFITVINRRTSKDDFDRLAAIHQTLKRQYPDWPLSGAYLQWGDLGQFEDKIEPHPHYHDDVLHARGYHDINSVTWWLLKNRGLSLYGPEPTTLDFSVDWDRLTVNMLENLNTYWRGFTRKPPRMLWLIYDYGIQWVILGVLRQFYTFREHDITSKTGSATYGLKHLPARWHPIIQEALNIRHQTKNSLYRSRITRALDAMRFLNYIIAVCNNLYIL